MKILEDVIDSLPHRDAKVREIHVCAHWTAVLSGHCGLASTFKEESHPHKGVTGVGQLTEKNAFDQFCTPLLFLKRRLPDTVYPPLW